MTTYAREYRYLQDPEIVRRKNALDRASAVWREQQARAALLRCPRAMPARVRTIIEAVAIETGIPVSDILGRRKVHAIIDARFKAIRRVRSETGWSSTRIGLVFDRDHTSIISALNGVGEYRPEPWARLAEAKSLRANGMTFKQIGERFGIDRSTVARRLAERPYKQRVRKSKARSAMVET